MLASRALPLIALTAGIVLRAAPLPQDAGAAGTWQRMLKLRTTVSVMHTTAHPDDEHGGLLTMLGRRDGARVSLLTLTRGESGDNAIGPQLFDALGLIRTEELLAADRYYGVDAQYFTTAADYGFSKRLDEALEKWGKEAVLRDVVRIIRMERPWILISRFQGNERDGHGNHSAAGLITQDAFRAAGDPNMFPEQLSPAVRPWQPFKVYIGGVRENERWTVRVDTNEYSPWIGGTYANFARLGLSFQRSQNGGRYTPQTTSAPAFYARVGSRIASRDKEAGFFDGIDTSMTGLFATLHETPPRGASDEVNAIDRAVTDAFAAFSMANPSSVVPALVRGLRATRGALNLVPAAGDSFVALKRKEQEFQDAINAATGVELSAIASVSFAPVPGQTFDVQTDFAIRGSKAVTRSSVAIEAADGWRVTPAQNGRFTVTLARDVAISTRPPFSRASIANNRYDIDDPRNFGRPASFLPATAVATYVVDGESVSVHEPVRRREPKLPYGDALRELRVVPALALTVEPAMAIVTASAAPREVAVTVDLLNNDAAGTAGELVLRMPPGWTSKPRSYGFTFARAGERRTYRFDVEVPPASARDATIEAIASAGGRSYQEGYEIIDQRDLELRYLYRPSTTVVRPVNVTVPSRLNVGYVMGIGDRVPDGIAQLGHAVTQLGERDLATGDLQRFDAIVLGTRAYAVRDDLNTYNQRLLEYVKGGGNVIVLYNTSEMDPRRVAPYPGELTVRAEEVSEEDSPVRILAPGDRVFTWPNAITPADFDGWVEQRGSKFWSSWAPQYTPMIETWDKGQAPQRGGWLTARFGSGHYTYFAYALHRQLPYAVPGAYRLLENLLALGSPRR
jgi:LmbE family N-acetylglucosaminyl deacetylase